MDRIFMCCFCLAGCVLAGEALPLTPLEVTATRSGETPFEQPYAFYRTDARLLDEGVGRTVLDRFNYGPGVFIQRTAPNQASPYIRGLTGEQTLLMLDGVRFNHAMMRPGPNQYSALIPDMNLSSIDAVLGASSALMGSDGLTGALDFRLAAAGRGVAEGNSPWLGMRVDHANGGTLQGGVDGVSGLWAYSLSLSGSSFHDRVGGKDFRDHVFGEGREAYDSIPNTAYDESAAALALAYYGFADRVLELKSGYSQQTDAPRPDGYFENSGKSDRLSRFFDPQTFSYVHLRDQWQVDADGLDRLQTTLWWHRFGEKQIRGDLRDGGVLLRRREYDDQLDALGLDLQAASFWGAEAQHELTWGATVIFESTDNQYTEFRNGAAYRPANWPNNTSVSDDSRYRSLGLFVQDHWQLTERFGLLSSLRYSRYDWAFGGVEGDAEDVSGGLRGEYKLSETQRVFVGWSKGFRAPNLINLDGAVDRGSNGQVAEGNPDLDPELSYSYEGGWKWQADADWIGLSAFYTQLDDLIQQEFSRGGGVFTNVEDARLKGGEAAWDLGLYETAATRYSLVGALSLVNGEQDVPQPDGRVRRENLSRANRLFGRLGLKLQGQQNWWGLLQMRWHDTYDKVAPGDADDVRLTVAGKPDGSMPGYEIFDVMLGWESDDGRVSLSLFIENLADESYREIGSGADAAGRNLGMTAGLRF